MVPSIDSPQKARDRGQHSSVEQRARRRRRISIITAGAVAVGVLGTAAATWLGAKATTIRDELNAATQLVSGLQESVANDDPATAHSALATLRLHTSAAKEAAEDPLWKLASVIPEIGINFAAVSEVARSADDVVNLGIAPLISVYGSLEWDSLVPSASGTDLTPLKDASPSVASAAHAVRVSAERLARIEATKLQPQVAEPLVKAREQLGEVTGTLDAAADASELIPGMLGSESPRNYLLVIQNNAEARASGGIPGALAVLSLDKGRLTLGAQSTATGIGVMSPTLPVDKVQEQIYSSRLGKFMQDVNLTPDFPTAAKTAQAMWERKTGQHVDGVLSIDPVALSYILESTGPVKLTSPELVALASGGLPTELTGKNVVPTLLSDVYSKIEEPALQDVYFAGVAQEIFSALSDGKGSGQGLIQGITRATNEGRVLVWSDSVAEQSALEGYPVSGSIAGPSVKPAQFSVYFNDGTGAKMDYYIKRTVQLIKECPKDGFEQITVRITSTNTAPADAATSLPAYVTGAGNFGVPAGSVQTNLVAYGPVQAQVETAKLDGQKTEFAPYLHSGRPVGVLATRLAPGESRTVDFTFGKIVQHTEPNLVVTPTVQGVKDVTLTTHTVDCS